jgi:hypothetical protein
MARFHVGRIEASLVVVTIYLPYTVSDAEGLMLWSK